MVFSTCRKSLCRSPSDRLAYLVEVCPETAEGLWAAQAHVLVWPQRAGARHGKRANLACFFTVMLLKNWKWGLVQIWMVPQGFVQPLPSSSGAITMLYTGGVPGVGAVQPCASFILFLVRQSLSLHVCPFYMWTEIHRNTSFCRIL